MDPDSIQKIAAEVVKSLPGTYSWTALIVQFSLTLIAVAIGVFLGEYGRSPKLILVHASKSRPRGQWSDDDYDV
jgi:hypothetical protein